MQLEKKIKQLESDIDYFVCEKIIEMLTLYKEYKEQKIGLSRLSVCRSVIY